MLEFRILGPVEIVRDGVPVRLESGLVRVLLAMLLLERNRLVPVDRLIDQLWDGEPTRTARPALQIYVAKLRKALAAAGEPDALVTRGAGYELQVAAGGLDAQRFRDLVSSGDRALADRRYEPALSSLSGALALWHGPALADLAANGWVEHRARELEEERLAALESRFDAELALGRHQTVLGDLRGFVADEPLRERGLRQLMIALYRCGRQGDAIQVYHDARAAFAEELGIPPGAELRDLLDAILREDPALRPDPVPAQVASLPAPATPLIGREGEVGELVGLLERPDVRLVTLSGPGGSGKTRLALATAAAAAVRFADGVIPVLLAGVEDPQLVPSAVARAAGVKQRGDSPVADELGAFFAVRETLLVLDNFEQVLGAGPFVAGLLARAPRLTVLVTSRALLRISAEHRFDVPPLALPEHPAATDVESAAASPAVRLFVERAGAVRPGFALSADNVDDVVGICAALDGLPLAIELAAARIRVLPPRALFQRLQERLPMLTGGAEDLPPRQRTMRAAMDWSHELLDAGVARVFAEVSVFAGGFTLPAAVAVGGPDQGEEDLLDALAALTDQSLMTERPDGEGEPRFSMLHIVREYAQARLRESGDDGACRRHADYFAQVAGEARFGLDGPEQTRWLGRLDAEYANLCAALGWALDAANTGYVARLCVGLRRYWWLRGLGREGRHWVDLSLAATAGEESEGRLELLVTASSVARYVGQDADARRFADEALDLARQLGQPRELARACGTRAQMAVTDGDFELARRLHQEDAELGHQAGDPVIEMVAIANLGEVALCEHDPETAARYSLQSLAIAQRTEDPLMIAVCQSQLAFAALMMGDLDRAEAHLQGALVPSRALRDLHSGMSCLIGGAALLAGREDAAGAARLLGAVEGLHERTERIVEPGTQPILRQAEELVRRRLEGPALSTPWEEGRNLTLEEALDGIIERVTPRG